MASLSLGSTARKLCIFEMICADGVMNTGLVHLPLRLGRQLAQNPRPRPMLLMAFDSGVPAAIGLQASGIPYAEGLIKKIVMWSRTLHPATQTMRESFA